MADLAVSSFGKQYHIYAANIILSITGIMHNRQCLVIWYNQNFKYTLIKQSLSDGLYSLTSKINVYPHLT